MKACPTCGEVLPAEMFYLRRGRPTGTCKACYKRAAQSPQGKARKSAAQSRWQAKRAARRRAARAAATSPDIIAGFVAVAHLLGVSRQRVAQWVAAGRLVPLRTEVIAPGRTRSIFSRAAVDAFAAQERRNMPKPADRS